MKRYLSYLIFLSCFMVLTPVYAGNQTLTTYYPAPQGNYKNVTVNNALEIASQTTYSCTSNANNNVFFANVAGNLEVCDSTGTVWPSNLWFRPTGQNYMYPASSSYNVGIGATSSPSYNLGVTGTMGVTGLATLGSASVTGNIASATLGVTGLATLGSATVTNNTTVGGTLGVTGLATLGSATVTNNATVGGTLGVTGLATLGSASVTNNATVGGTLGVTGLATLGSLSVTNNASVSGNTTLGAANNNTTTITGYIAGDEVVNGAVRVNAGSGIYYCTGTTTNPASGCQQLMVASNGGGGYYAEYAP